MTAPSTPQKGTIDVLNAQSLGYAEDFRPGSEAVRAASDNAVLLGAPPLSTGTATALTFLARLINASAVVEIGTGTGISALALFEGMAADGILTSIDSETDWQLEARQALLDVGIPSRRFRLISGTPLDVLNNLRDGAYDLVFINGDKLEYVEYVAQALRLLRHGGVLVLNNALWHNLIAERMNEDDETVIIREALTAVLETAEFTSVLLPLGDGLVAAIKD